MTGIAMLERLEKILPDCVPIFMSGYSDKEYLKAAIKLKAVNYIEKPLHPEEVRDAVLRPSLFTGRSFVPTVEKPCTLRKQPPGLHRN